MVTSGEIGDVVRMNLYEATGQMGTHGLTEAYRFAGRTDVDLVVGWASGDPSSETEDEHKDGRSGYGALGGYIRFKNGIELFSNYQAPGHYWKSLEIMGTKGVIFGQNTTGLGLRMFKSTTSEPPTSWDQLEEIEGVFEDPPALRDRPYDEDGWREPGHVMSMIADEMVDYLENGRPIGSTRGDDMRHALEIAIAMRESARNGNTPVTLPIEDRSIRMLPQKSRWFYKKTLMGSDAYMAQLAQQKRD
jgi:predicted dehydrogenase